MNIIDLLNSHLFFTVLLKNNYFFHTLEHKYPEILADLVSSRDNPNCSCKNRVKNYLISKADIDASFFETLLSNHEIRTILNSNNFIINENPSQGIPPHLRHGQSKIYRIAKDDNSWNMLAQRIRLENPFFKSFYVSERENQLVVYVI